MKTLILCLCLLALPAVAQTVDREKAIVGVADPHSTANFAKKCESAAPACSGFLMGASVFVSQDVAPHCLPATTHEPELRRDFLAWYKGNQTAQALVFHVSVVRFLMVTYPCAQRS